MEDSKLIKLPVWAQREIKRLTRDLEASESKVAQLSGFYENSSVTCDGGCSVKEFFLHPSSTVTFSLPSGYVEVNSRDGRVQIRGAGRIGIFPSSANSISVAVEAY